MTDSDYEYRERRTLNEIKTINFFLTQNCVALKSVDCKITNVGWAKKISKWSGVSVFPSTFHNVAKGLNIPFVEISLNVYAYGLKEMK